MSSLWFILDWSVRISIYIYICIYDFWTTVIWIASAQVQLRWYYTKCIIYVSFCIQFHDQMRWSSSWSRNFILGNIYTSPFPWVVLPARSPKTRGRPVQWILELQDLRKWAARLVAHPCFEAWTKFLATSLWQGMTKLGKRNHVMKP